MGILNPMRVGWQLLASPLRLIGAALQRELCLRRLVGLGLMMGLMLSAHAQPIAEDAWMAIRAGDQRALEAAMLKIGPNASHPQHGPLIVFAAHERAFEVVRFLARTRGIEIDKPNRNQETALMLVAMHGDEALARQLIQRGAQVNRPGWTPLHYATTGGHLGMVKLLIEEHAFIDAQSPNQTTPLMMAARMRHPSVVRLLIEEGADPSQANQAGIDAATYLERAGYAQEATWVRERAAAYLARYGTVLKPRVSSGTTLTPEPDKSTSNRPAQSQGSSAPSTPAVTATGGTLPERPAINPEPRPARNASGRSVPEVVTPGATPTNPQPRQP